MRFINVFIAVLIAIVISVAATVFVLKFTPANSNAAKALILKATKGAVNIEQQFKGPHNLIGFVVKGKTKAAPMAIFYVDRAGHYLFSGTLIGEHNGKITNLTEQNYFTYIQPKTALLAYRNLANTHWISQGQLSAPHKMYVLVDPNCIACHLFYDLLQPQIKSGDLAVRWILVSFLKPSSVKKAEAILSAKDPVAAMALNEKNFNSKTEEGGIAPLATVPGGIAAKVKANNQFMMTNKITMTPTFIYKTKNGLIKMHPGGLNAPGLKRLMSNVSDQF